VLAAGLWSAHADPNQLENAVLNLAVNARDAMPDGGRMTIETANAYLDDRYVAEHSGVPPGQYVMLAVTDTGSGMTGEVAAKAFDPFFTTKKSGLGTGLGLSQVYGFVKQSGGHVNIYSEVGKGTTIKVYLPRHFGTEQARLAAARTTLPTSDGSVAILVVEDEEGVRRYTTDALRDLGYRVLEADGPKAALAIIDAEPDIAVLFTDVVMPDMNGKRLAEAALARRPSLKVLFTTGYTRNAIVHNGMLDPGVNLLSKPFTLEDLAQKVAEVVRH
jgi:CheY-like chemotaxis protein